MQSDNDDDDDDRAKFVIRGFQEELSTRLVQWLQAKFEYSAIHPIASEIRDSRFSHGCDYDHFRSGTMLDLCLLQARFRAKKQLDAHARRKHMTNRGTQKVCAHSGVGNQIVNANHN